MSSALNKLLGSFIFKRRIVLFSIHVYMYIRYMVHLKHGKMESCVKISNHDITITILNKEIKSK